MIFFLTALAVFILMVISDGLWTYYIQMAAEDKRLPASFTSSGLVLIGGITILIYVHNPIMIIPEMFGAFVGTYFVMKYTAKRKQNQKEK